MEVGIKKMGIIRHVAFHPTNSSAPSTQRCHDSRSENLSCLDPWLVVGDFNSVMTSDEVSTRGAFDKRSAGFLDWIFEQQIIDLGYSRPRFTWSEVVLASPLQLHA